MTERSIAHGSFTVERKYKHAPSKVYSAWSNPEFKRQWFGSPSPDKPKDVMDFRVGGREFNEAEMGGDTYVFDVTYRDIVPDNRMAREFRDHAGRLHQSIAARARQVYFVAAGLPLKMKG